jgi:hypothetical protein
LSHFSRTTNMPIYGDVAIEQEISEQSIDETLNEPSLELYAQYLEA